MRIAIYCNSYFPNRLDALEQGEVFDFYVPSFLFSAKKADKIAKKVSDLIPGGHTLSWFAL